jgi:hypothetical protein
VKPEWIVFKNFPEYGEQNERKGSVSTTTYQFGFFVFPEKAGERIVCEKAGNSLEALSCKGIAINCNGIILSKFMIQGIEVNTTC